MSWLSRQFPAGRPCSPASPESWSSHLVATRQSTELLAFTTSTPARVLSDSCSQPSGVMWLSRLRGKPGPASNQEPCAGEAQTRVGVLCGSRALESALFLRYFNAIDLIRNSRTAPSSPETDSMRLAAEPDFAFGKTIWVDVDDQTAVARAADPARVENMAACVTAFLTAATAA